MAWTAAAIGLSGVLGFAGASKAAKAQSKATDAATALQWEQMEWQKRMYEEDKTRRRPYYDLSMMSLPELQKFISGDFDITGTQEYKTQSAALDRQLAKHLSARGLQSAGFGAEEDARLKTGLMGNLYNQRFSRLASLANLGSMGMAQAPGLENAYSNLSNLAMQRGQGQAQMYSSLGQLPMNMMNAYSMWNYLNKSNYGGLTGSQYNELSNVGDAWNLY